MNFKGVVFDIDVAENGYVLRVTKAGQSFDKRTLVYRDWYDLSRFVEDFPADEAKREEKKQKAFEAQQQKKSKNETISSAGN